MSEPKFKAGDWVFCEFILQMIKKVDKDRVTCVSDGMFELSGNDLSDRCFPLTLRNKRVSDEVNHWRKRLHELKTPGLNHPDLNRELIRRWVQMCECDDKDLQSLYDSLGDFCRKIEKTEG